MTAVLLDGVRDDASCFGAELAQILAHTVGQPADGFRDLVIRFGAAQQVRGALEFLPEQPVGPWWRCGRPGAGVW